MGEGIRESLRKIPEIQILAIVGPTASGKTSLAVELAERLGTEVISADSMQVYRGMEIGTGAPSPEEQARVKHHFVGFLNPTEQFCAGDFGQAARRVVDALNANGKIAVVAGGSGLYVESLIDGLFPGPGKDESIRLRLHQEAEAQGVEQLYRTLLAVDPEYAATILPGDLRRIVRALEVYELTGEPLSRLHREHRSESRPLRAIQVALDWPREALYERINARVDRMLERGFLDEVRTLLNSGLSDRLEQLRTLGYREFAAHFRGEKSYDDAVQAMKQNTRRFAKRQLSWFRGDERIRWMPACDEIPLAAHVEEVLENLAC